jgi:hypothetical protein
MVERSDERRDASMGRAESVAGLNVVSAARARTEMKTIFDRAIHDHLPVPMERDGVERMFGIGLQELKLLLDPFDFHAEVLFEDEGVSIWLKEFAIYGSGDDFEEAKADLVDEALEYVTDYFSDANLRQAPNRRGHYPHALRVAVAALEENLDEVLLAAPREAVGASA